MTAPAPAPNGQTRTPGTALTPQQISRQKIVGTVEQYAEQIAALAPRGTNPAHYVAALRLHLSQNPKLLDCTPISIAQGILRTAQTGLELGVTCDLLPFGPTCQFNPRYTGIIDLAIAAGARAINADVVYDDDPVWAFQKGTEFFLRHQRGPRKGQITHFYAIAELKPGSYVFEVMTAEEVDEHRRRFSKSWWWRRDPRTKKEITPKEVVPLSEVRWYGKKTAVRQLSAFLPKNPRFAAALAFAAEADEEPVDDASEVPEGEFEVVDEAAAAAPAAEPVSSPAPAPQAKASAPGRATEEQTERLLDLVSDGFVTSDVKEKVELALKDGLPPRLADAWIDILEAQRPKHAHAEEESTAELLPL